jgi:hypothetical protein|tara:strand:- start:4638 stop:5036 length:399 start_codon:yes stop_codon:yes gene_type:complete
MIKLQSVGSLLDKKQETVYPMNSDGSPDLEMGIHISYLSEDWMDRLNSKDRIEIFQTLIKEIKFTPPQQKVVDRIMKGYSIEVINRHHMNGGEMRWKHPDSEYLDPAGSIYKSFFNTMRKIDNENITSQFIN